MESVLLYVKAGDLVCISLGPTATVLAYDIARKGIQALDIGQLDNEYDWYQSGAMQRTAIWGKMVAEIDVQEGLNCFDNRKYTAQIVAEIE